MRAIVIAAFVMVACAHGQSAPVGHAPVDAIGVVDLDRVLAETPAGKRATADFEADRATRVAALDTERRVLEHAAEVLAAARMLSTHDDLVTMMYLFTWLQRRFSARKSALDRDVAAQHTTLRRRIQALVSPLLPTLAHGEGVQVVVARDRMVWVAPALDLTDKLIARMQ